MRPVGAHAEAAKAVLRAKVAVHVATERERRAYNRWRRLLHSRKDARAEAAACAAWHTSYTALAAATATWQTAWDTFWATRIDEPAILGGIVMKQCIFCQAPISVGDWCLVCDEPVQAGMDAPLIDGRALDSRDRAMARNASEGDR